MAIKCRRYGLGEDVPDLDPALPHNAAGLDDGAYDIAAQARAAWEAAVCWDPSGTDQFAVNRLAEVRAVIGALPQPQGRSSEVMTDFMEYPQAGC